MQIFSFSPFGYEGSLVTVEVDLRRGIPAVDIVGLADGAVKESRERMRSAIRNCGFEFPLERVLISLSPADLKKEGAGFDLAVALGVLYASEGAAGRFNSQVLETEDILIMGELELCGNVRAVRGIHAAVTTAAASGISYCIVPAANATEAREVNGVKVFGAENLSQAFDALQNKDLFTSKNSLGQQQPDSEEYEVIEGVEFEKEIPGMEYTDVSNQLELIRGLQIAAAGGHNLMAFGPPGCGKTLSLQRFPGLLPLLTVEEAQPVTRIYSLAGMLKSRDSLVRTPPFRMPHQTASIEGICGGGPNCRPGEISLAHNGVLFLDEAAEFKTSVLQMLRVPIESGSITLSRAGRSTVYPARFQLLLATNPCPCGNYGSDSKLCLCSARAVENYWNKFSGPLLDRIDIRVNVSLPCSQETDDSTPQKISTTQLRIPIARAVNIQRKRQGIKNAQLDPQAISRFCITEKEAQEYLDEQAAKNDFSPRAVASCLKLGRTIADMEQSRLIGIEHIREAVFYRKLEGGIA